LKSKCVLGIFAGFLVLFCCACGSGKFLNSSGFESKSTIRTTSTEPSFLRMRIINKNTDKAKIIDNPNDIAKIKDMIKNAPKEAVPYEALYGGRLCIQLKGNGEAISYFFIGNYMLVNNEERYIVSESFIQELEHYYEQLSEDEVEAYPLTMEGW
jgi:hypothetical protein